MESGHEDRPASLYRIGVILTIIGYSCIFGVIIDSDWIFGLLPVRAYVGKPLFCFMVLLVSVLMMIFGAIISNKEGGETKA